MLDRGRTEEAVGHLERAVRADPKLAPAHYRLALAYRKLGLADRAKAELELFAKSKAKGEQAGDRDRIVRSLAADR
jgi:tetratricopeptide (TPR) repeat protein